LRCGIASQTHTAPSDGAGKANRGSHPGEGEGRGKAGSAEQSAGRATHAESEYLARNKSSSGAIARAGSENFIAIVKKASE
jgi:hypothetical protein